MTTPPWPSPVSSLVVLTDRSGVPDGRDLLTQVAAAVDGGARTVVLREKDLPRTERRQLAEALRDVVHAAGGLLLVASDAGLAAQAGADGVHLAAGDARPDPHDGPFVVGRSTHDLDELLGAQAERVGYATYSPIFASASKPGYGPALGLDGLRAAAARVRIPVYALGGVTPARARACRLAGAAGVAVMGDVMRAADPAAAVADLLAAMEPPTRSPGAPPTPAPLTPARVGPAADRIGGRP